MPVVIKVTPLTYMWFGIGNIYDQQSDTAMALVGHNTNAIRERGKGPFIYVRTFWAIFYSSALSASRAQKWKYS